MKNTLKSLLALILILISTNLFSQIQGEWMISYSYPPIDYNGEFNMSRKNIEHKAILIINSDSIKSIYSEKWRRQKQKKFRYEYKKDSLFIEQGGGQKLKYEFQVYQDTIKYIDREYKGFYMVLHSISKPKKKIEN